MYFSFQVLDRLLTVFYGFNFQPFGPEMPPGFAIWGHLANGSAALLGTWLAVTLWRRGQGRHHGWLLRAVVALVALGTMTWIPYMNDAKHLTRHGEAGTLPLYLFFNVIYVLGMGLLAVLLRNRWRLVVIAALVVAFLVLHFACYLPLVPDFAWL